MIMKMHNVESSWIKSIGANPSEETLDVHLKSGAEYRYYNVPEHMLTEMLEAESMGKFFAANIGKGGKSDYSYKKLN